jgi:peptidoglycan/LPS O-acetylase OafA/YrhL
MNPYEKPLTDAPNHARSYYKGLDGLRGIAILLIVGYHVFNFLPFFEYGWLGVDLFFVLSGYLITDILIKSRDQEKYISRFYIRRVLRIFPIYYLCLFIFIILLPALQQVPYNASYYNEHQINFWLYMSNWLFILKSPEETFFLNHLWSLALEQQFYFIWPWVILFITNSKKLLQIVAALPVILILLRFAVSYFYPGKMDYGILYTFSRVDGLFIGSALAVYLHSHIRIQTKYLLRIFAGLAVLNLAFLTASFIPGFTLPYFPFLGYTTFAMIFGFIVYSVITQQEETRWTRFLSQPALCSIGRISYGFYIYHWPIYLLFCSGIKTYLYALIPGGGVLIQLAAAVIITLMAILVSIVSYVSIERYFLRFKHAFQ